MTHPIKSIQVMLAIPFLVATVCLCSLTFVTAQESELAKDAADSSLMDVLNPATIHRAWEERESEYEHLNLSWTVRSSVPTETRSQGSPFDSVPAETEDADHLKLTRFSSSQNHMRLNGSAIGVEFQHVWTHSKKPPVLMLSRFSWIDREFRGSSDSLGQGSIHRECDFLLGGSSTWVQFAIVANYRPGLVRWVSRLKEQIASEELRLTEWGGRRALLLSVTDGSVLNEYYLDADHPGHFLGLHSLNHSEETEFRLEVFPADESERFQIQKVVRQQRIRSKEFTLNEVYEDFQYDFDNVPSLKEVALRFSDRMHVTIFNSGKQEVFINRVPGGLEPLDESNVRELDVLARNALRL